MLFTGSHRRQKIHHPQYATMKKFVILSLTIILLAVASYIVINRWNIWFGNPVESPYQAQSAPYHILLTFSPEGDDFRCITWQCDTLAGEASLLYSLRDSGDTATITTQPHIYHSQGGASAFYRADLHTPQPGIYDYRICMKADSSQWLHFTLHDTTSDTTAQFIYLGDIQDTINGITNNIVTDIVQHYPATDFFILGGDFIHRPLETYWDEAFRGIAPIATQYPVAAVSGNHEYLKGLNASIEPRFILHFPYFPSSYLDNGACATLTYGDIQIFLLDSNAGIVSLFKQSRWLDKALRNSSARWKIAVLHHSPYSIRSPYNNLDIKFLFDPLFKKHKVDFVLAGHEHGYARRTTRDLDNHKQTPIYTVSHCSPKQYPLYINNRTDRYGTGNRYFQQFTAHGDTMHMRTFTTDFSLYDDIVLIKSPDKTLLIDQTDTIPERLELPDEVAQRLKPGQIHEYNKSLEERAQRHLPI